MGLFLDERSFRGHRHLFTHHAWLERETEIDYVIHAQRNPGAGQFLETRAGDFDCVGARAQKRRREATDPVRLQNARNIAGFHSDDADVSADDNSAARIRNYAGNAACRRLRHQQHRRQKRGEQQKRTRHETSPAMSPPGNGEVIRGRFPGRRPCVSLAY